ncbi:MAG: protein phosphatase CheZ [Alphaproteobacteria bacterium]|nr:protein phosphatase CheZ [Alphaproteobacteria bacterium]
MPGLAVMKDHQGLQEHLSQLVDFLRKDIGRQFTIADLASLTEVLVGTMRRFVESIDLKVYRELDSLHTYIRDTKRELAKLSPAEIKHRRIPRAGEELGAIVRATEEATNTIMGAAETLMGADASDAAQFKALVDEQCMKIFEACSFQDITGQRVTKVVSTLSHIEERLNGLAEVLGLGNEEAPPEVDTREGDAKLLHGPALAGEGVNQSEADALMSGADPAAIVKTKKPAETKPAAKPAAAPTPAPAAAPAADGGKKSSQADIDALFD